MDYTAAGRVFAGYLLSSCILEYQLILLIDLYYYTWFGSGFPISDPPPRPYLRQLKDKVLLGELP